MRRMPGWVPLVAFAIGCTNPLAPSRGIGGTDAGIDRHSGWVGPTVVDAAGDVGRGGGSGADAAREMGTGLRPDPAPLGVACRSVADCASGFCADGVCCNASCAAPCLTCAVAGLLGTCVARTVGTAPRIANRCPASNPATCGLTGLCDGEGGCALYPAETLCMAPACADSMTLRQASVCDGLGICVAGANVVCTPYTCSEGACAVDDCKFDPLDCVPPGNRDASLD